MCHIMWQCHSICSKHRTAKLCMRADSVKACLCMSSRQVAMGCLAVPQPACKMRAAMLLPACNLVFAYPTAHLKGGSYHKSVALQQGLHVMGSCVCVRSPVSVNSSRGTCTSTCTAVECSNPVRLIGESQSMAACLAAIVRQDPSSYAHVTSSRSTSHQA